MSAAWKCRLERHIAGWSSSTDTLAIAEVDAPEGEPVEAAVQFCRRFASIIRFEWEAILKWRVFVTCSPQTGDTAARNKGAERFALTVKQDGTGFSRLYIEGRTVI